MTVFTFRVIEDKRCPHHSPQCHPPLLLTSLLELLGVGGVTEPWKGRCCGADSGRSPAGLEDREDFCQGLYYLTDLIFAGPRGNFLSSLHMPAIYRGPHLVTVSSPPFLRNCRVRDGTRCVFYKQRGGLSLHQSFQSESLDSIPGPSERGK